MSYWTGKKRSEDDKKKMSIAAKKRTSTPEYKKDFVKRVNKNGKLSKYHNDRLSKRLMKTCPKCGIIFLTKPSHFLKRMYCSRKCKAEVMSEKTGELSLNWKGGKTEAGKLIRNSKEYSLWRTAVFERDNFTCVWCYEKGGKLEADHIKPFAYYPELRFAIDNGRTLCINCHKKTETYGRPKKK